MEGLFNIDKFIDVSSEPFSIGKLILLSVLSFLGAYFGLIISISYTACLLHKKERSNNQQEINKISKKLKQSYVLIAVSLVSTIITLIIIF